MESESFHKDVVIKTILFLVKEEKINYSREVKIFHELFNLYPKKEFWVELQLDFKLNSLAFFLSNEGKNVLNKKYNLFKMYQNKKEVYELSDKAVIKLEPQKKVQSLVEFLDN